MKFEDKIIATWEDVYKKGQLTFWLLLSLKQAAAHMGDMKKFIEAATNGSLVADDQSMYRALRRLTQMELIDYQEQSSTKGGADIKIYALTKTGRSVLDTFIRRNIANVYYKPTIKQLILQ